MMEHKRAQSLVSKVYSHTMRCFDVFVANGDGALALYVNPDLPFSDVETANKLIPRPLTQEQEGCGIWTIILWMHVGYMDAYVAIEL